MSGSDDAAVESLADVVRAEFLDRLADALAVYLWETRGRAPDVELLLLVFRETRDRAMRDVAGVVGRLFDGVREQRSTPSSEADADARFLFDWTLNLAQARLRYLWRLPLERGAVVELVDELLPVANERASRLAERLP